MLIVQGWYQQWKQSSIEDYYLNSERNCVENMSLNSGFLLYSCTNVIRVDYRDD